MPAVTAATVRLRRSRNAAAFVMLSWAMTLGNICLIANYVERTLVDEATFAQGAADMAVDPEVRAGLADALADSLAESVPGTDLADTQRRELARGLDTAAVTDMLLHLRAEALGEPVEDKAGRWSELAPGTPLSSLGVTDVADVIVSPQIPNAGWLAAVMPAAARFTLLGSLVLLIGAFLTSLSRLRVASQFGRWGLIAASVSLAVSWVLPWFLGLIPSPWGSAASALLGASASSLTPLFASLGVFGAALWGTGISAQRWQTARAAEGVEGAITIEDRSRAQAAVIAEAPAATGGLGLTTPSGRALPYWARAGHPLPSEPFVESALTRDLDPEELARVVTSAATAWARPQAANEDDAALLRLLLEDRGSFHQVARLWERYDDLPLACARVALAYEDFVLHAANYAELLDIPEFAIVDRIGPMASQVRAGQVKAFSAKLATLYNDLAETLGTTAPAERNRLAALASSIPA